MGDREALGGVDGEFFVLFSLGRSFSLCLVRLIPLNLYLFHLILFYFLNF